MAPRRSCPTPRACGPSASTRGATRGRPGCTRSRSRSRSARAPRSCANDLEIGARCWTGSRAGRTGAPSATLLVMAAERLRDTDRPLPARVAAGAGRAPVTRDHDELPGARARSRTGPARTRSGWTAGGRCSAPGTSCSRAPPAAVDETGRAGARHVRHRGPAQLDRVADDGLRRGVPAADPPDRRGQPQGPEQQRWSAGPGTSARRGRSARAEGGHDAIHPGWAPLADFDAFVARAAELGLEVALDLALQCAPDHPWVPEHPEWFTTKPGRHDRVRGEPAQALPGHLPDQLRQRPGRACTPRCCASCMLLDRARRADLPGGQPAHQAAGLLALADLAGEGRPIRTCCSWPRRSPAPRGSTASPGSASPSPTPTSPGARPSRS